MYTHTHTFRVAWFVVWGLSLEIEKDTERMMGLTNAKIRILSLMDLAQVQQVIAHQYIDTDMDIYLDIDR